jgi:hypothetical protein
MKQTYPTLSRDFSLLIVMRHSVLICFKLLQIETNQFITQLFIQLIERRVFQILLNNKIITDENLNIL